MCGTSDSPTSLWSKLDKFLLAYAASERQEMDDLIDTLNSVRGVYGKRHLSVGRAFSVMVFLMAKVKSERLFLTGEALVLLLVWRDLLEVAINALNGVNALSQIQAERLDEVSAHLEALTNVELLERSAAGENEIAFIT